MGPRTGLQPRSRSPSRVCANKVCTHRVHPSLAVPDPPRVAPQPCPPCGCWPHPLRSRLLAELRQPRRRRRHVPGHPGAEPTAAPPGSGTCASSPRSAWWRTTAEGGGAGRIWTASTSGRPGGRTPRRTPTTATTTPRPHWPGWPATTCTTSPDRADAWLDDRGAVGPATWRRGPGLSEPPGAGDPASSSRRCGRAEQVMQRYRRVRCRQPERQAGLGLPLPARRAPAPTLTRAARRSPQDGPRAAISAGLEDPPPCAPARSACSRPRPHGKSAWPRCRRRRPAPATGRAGHQPSRAACCVTVAGKVAEDDARPRRGSASRPTVSSTLITTRPR